MPNTELGLIFREKRVASAQNGRRIPVRSRSWKKQFKQLWYQFVARSELSTAMFLEKIPVLPASRTRRDSAPHDQNRPEKRPPKAGELWGLGAAVRAVLQSVWTWNGALSEDVFRKIFVFVVIAVEQKKSTSFASIETQHALMPNLSFF